jgi:uroporphyrinogen-III synthase
VLARADVKDLKALTYVAEHLGLFSRVVIDSPWSARQLADAFRQAGVWPKQTLLAVDEATRDAMELLHWPVMVLPTERISDGSIAFITRTRTVIPESLTDCDELTLVEVGGEPVLPRVELFEGDALVVCAPADASQLHVDTVKAAVVIAAGPTTAHELSHRGIEVTAVAAKPSAEVIVQTTLKALGVH